MNEIKVVFLDSEYIFPNEVTEYVDYLIYFLEKSNNLQSLLDEEMRRQVCRSKANNEIVYRIEMENIAKELIKKLALQGVYDVTINDLIMNNHGYQYIEAIDNLTGKGLEDLERTAEQNLNLAQNEAYNRAASSITGSGVGILTNSISGALLYSFMEGSTLKSQTREAERQYSKEINSLTRSIQSQKSEANRKLLDEIYYPGIQKAIKEFIDILIDTYLRILQDRNVFNYSVVEKYDIRRSNDILKNVEILSGYEKKKEVIKQAFCSCPYNISIFRTLIEYEWFDEKSFSAAKSLNLDALIFQQLYDKVQERKWILNNVETNINILKALQDKPEKEIVYLIYGSDIRTVKNEYTLLHKLISDDSLKNEIFEKWLKPNIELDKEKDWNKIRDALKTEIHKRIYEVIDENQFSILHDLNVLEISDIRLPESICVSVDEVNIEIEKQLLQSTMEWSRSRQKEQERIDRETALIEEKRKKEQERKNRKRFTLGAVAFAIIIISFIGYQQYNEYKSKETIYYQAVGYLNAGEWDKAKKAFEELGSFKDAEKRFASVDKIKDEHYTSEMDRINTLIDNKEYEEAYNSLNKENPYFEDNRNNINQLYYFYALELYEKGQYDDGLDVLHETTTSFSENNSGYYILEGKLYYAKEEYDEANISFTKIPESELADDVKLMEAKSRQIIQERENEEQFQEAKELLKVYKFKKAKKILKNLGKYKNADTIIEIIDKETNRIGFYKPTEGEDQDYMIVQVDIDAEKLTAKYVFDNIGYSDLEDAIDYYNRQLENNGELKFVRNEKSRNGNLITIIDDKYFSFEWTGETTVIRHISYDGDTIYSRVKGMKE